MFLKNELPILGILRGISQKDTKPLVDICKKAGLKYLEITMNTAHADNLIRSFKEESQGKIHIGAGTVLDRTNFKDATIAGAEFIVTPSVNEVVITLCRERNIPVFPGGLTPTEVHKAWSLGAEMVKLFPANLHGPGYIKSLRGPFEGIKIMAVGGVDDKNIGEYFKEGVNAVAFGAGIVRPEWLLKERYDLIEERILNLIRVYNGSVQV
jgi:2-dehydro-3-deoxyphosphogluconate aldolase / (4S)-4-hydroxy-2-oxoglutarate aldolase